LLKKLKKAALQTGITELCLAGGVSANSGLRKSFEELCRNNNWNAYIPPFEYCTDNAAMIAITGYYKYLDNNFSELSVSASARAGWS
jgi:N6-L-threonylcarbamoyladenine synthase